MRSRQTVFSEKFRIVFETMTYSIQSKFWQNRPRIANNPVILRELVERLRKKSSFVFLFFFVGIVGGAFVLFYPRLIQSLTQNTIGGIRSQEIYVLFSLLLGILLLVLIPLFSASCVNLERERKTWDLLITTPIRISSILLGKYLSSVFFAIILLSALIPMFGVLLLIGGVSPQEILFMFCILLELAATAGAIGLYCSIRWKRSVQSASFAYLWIVLLYVVPPTLIVMNYSPSTQPLGPLIFFSPFMIVFQFLGNDTLFPCSDSVALLIHGILAGGILLGWINLGVRELTNQSLRFSIQKWIARPSALHPLSFSSIYAIFRWFNGRLFRSSSQFREKEIKDFLGESDVGFIKSQIGVLLASLVLLSIGFSNAHCFFEYYYSLCIYAAAILTPCLIIPFGANGFRAEVDRETWLLLLSTNLSPKEIFQGKFLAGLSLFLARIIPFIVIPLFLAIAQTIALSLAYFGAANLIFIGKNVTIVLLFYTILYLSARFYLSGSLLASTLPKTTLAYAAAFLFAILVAIGPQILLFGLEIFDQLFITPPVRDPGDWLQYYGGIHHLLAAVSPVQLLIYLSYWKGGYELEFIFQTLIEATPKTKSIETFNLIIAGSQIFWLCLTASIFKWITIWRLRKTMYIK